MSLKKSESLVSINTDVGSIEYLTSWRYNSPLVQVFLTAIVAFGCPGMFNSLSGIGAGGQVNSWATDTGNIALYSINAAIYLFVAPIVYHLVGAKWCMFLGGITYPLYGASLLAYNYIESSTFVIVAASLLGVGSSHLWVGQGAIMTGAPMKQEKGRLIGLFWLVFNMGGVIGSFIAMGVNWKSEINKVSNATYAVFISLMAAGFLSALLILNPKKIIRNDGSQVRVDEVKPNVLKDFIEILKIFKRKETYFLLPFFAASNFCYTYQQNTFNGRLFDIRTRGFNGGFYWLGSLTSPLFGALLDSKKLTRKRRALLGFCLIACLHIAIFSGGLALQLRSPSSAHDEGEHKYKPHDMDLIRSKAHFAGPFVLYFLYGVFDTLWQTFAYWIIAYMGRENDDLAARYVGLYKSVQSVGAAVAWKLNQVPINYNTEFAINWGLVGGSLLVMSPFIFLMDSKINQ